MFKRLSLVAALAALFLQATPSFADACSSRARAFVANKPATTLLAVQSKVNNNGQLTCVVTVKIAGKNGKPPRIVTRQFKP